MHYAWDSFPNNAGDGALKHSDVLPKQKNKQTNKPFQLVP